MHNTMGKMGGRVRAETAMHPLASQKTLTSLPVCASNPVDNPCTWKY